MSGCDYTVAPEEGTGLAVVALPVALDDIDGIEYLAVSPVDVFCVAFTVPKNDYSWLLSHL